MTEAAFRKCQPTATGPGTHRRTGILDEELYRRGWKSFITGGVEGSMPLNPPKIMIVCSEVNDNLKSQLVGDGWVVNWVYDAETAIAKLRRERFDLAVLMSTGKKMDEMETFFNLKDIQKTLPVIAVRRSRDTKSALEGETSVPPNSGLRSVQGLEGLLSLLSNGDLHRRVGPD